MSNDIHQFAGHFTHFLLKNIAIFKMLYLKINNLFLPGYQKGVLPKYLRERKEQTEKELEVTKADEDHIMCPPGHVTLPDNERKETLRMLRNSKCVIIILSYCII